MGFCPDAVLNVEMWERFSYYGMRAILLYFITDTVANGGLGLSDNSGQVILAAYSAAVYLLAIPGGIFADRIIGPWPSRSISFVPFGALVSIYTPLFNIGQSDFICSKGK